MPRLRVRLLVVAVAATLGASALASAAERPLLAVLPFTGPQAKQAEAVVVRTLRKKAQLIPPATWNKAAAKLFAHTHSAEDISAVAEDIGAQIVITGIVKRDGRKWELSVGVRDGKSGKAHDRLRYPLKGPRLTPATLTLLAKEVGDAFESMVQEPASEPSAVSRQPSASEPAAEVKAKDKAKQAKQTGEPEPRRPIDTQLSPEPRTPTVVPIDEPPPPVLVKSLDEGHDGKQAKHGRPRWAPYFDADAGVTVSGRSFDYDPASQPKFSSGVVAGVRGDLTLYPLASTWNKAGGVFAGLGLGATVDKPFWPQSTSKQDPTQKFATSELRVEGGLRWRITLYKSLPRPELLLAAGGGLHTFTIGKDPMGLDVGPADVSYKYASFGGGFGVHFAEWASLWAMFDYHLVFDSGAVSDVATEYGPVKTFGVRVRGGLDFFIYKGLKLGAQGFYERFSLTFNPGSAMPAKVANSGLDQYFGGVITVGYVL